MSRDLLFYRRHREIVPRLDEIDAGGIYRVLDKAAVVVRWRLAGGAELMLAANLCNSPIPGFSAPSGRVIWREGEVDGGIFGPFAVRWSIGEKEAAQHV
jgi:Domain of unknown function (DUF3459)